MNISLTNVSNLSNILTIFACSSTEGIGILRLVNFSCVKCGIVDPVFTLSTKSLNILELK